jgi:hypothetical protein
MGNERQQAGMLFKGQQLELHLDLLVVNVLLTQLNQQQLDSEWAPSPLATSIASVA